MIAVLLGLFLVVALAGCVQFLVLWLRTRKKCGQLSARGEVSHQESEQRLAPLRAEIQKLRAANEMLRPYARIADAEAAAREISERARGEADRLAHEAQRLLADAEERRAALLEQADNQARSELKEARDQARRITDAAEASLKAAALRSADIVAEADRRAAQIAGDAYEAKQNASLYEATARAMKNIIEGYGDEYLTPSESLLDDLAEEFSYQDAGRQLKQSRAHTKAMIKAGLASRCEYVESSRREGAERFVLDAFNGKVDSILSRVKHDNAGKLTQEIRDAFTLVNHGGRAFRAARVTQEYLDARLQELKWGAVAQELKRRDQEEQRRIRDQIREEEKARREFERAMREAAKEEEVIRNAMVKAEARIAAASAEQRAAFEAQLAELQGRLHAAEEKNQRALSMAQQTRKGHVYVISNVGSFGENIYKIGLTRRLDPMDRIWELGDSSVPFDFDVHAMILADDAPALECRLHKHFLLKQVNKVNHRKEFFRAELAEIRKEIEGLGIGAQWTMRAQAAEYRETLAIERTIESDPAAREAWINRQLTLDPVEYKELGAEPARGEVEAVVLDARVRSGEEDE